MFSATMPDEIQKLANNILVNPVKVAVAPVSSTAEKVRQWVLFVEHGNKRPLLREVLRDPAMTRVLVFTRMKHVANRVSEELERHGISSAAIHGNKSQNARQRALDAFKTGGVRVLVATDIAARGIDVDGVSHVINFELPDEPESYVHRIGRTARAGASGVALSFCSPDERGALRDIERVIRAQVPVVTDHPYAGRPAPQPAGGGDSERGRPQHGRARRGGGGGGGGGRRFGRRR
jgi:ATP-dependent RNA helicase RhlE